jgi:histone H2A
MSSEKIKSEKRKRTVKSGKTVDGFKFSVYIARILRQVHPDTRISGAASASMVNIVKINVSKIMKAVNQLILRSGAATVQSRDVQTAVRLVLPGELAKHSVSEGTKAVTKYHASTVDHVKGSAKSKPIQKSSRAGLVMNVTRIENLMMLESVSERKSATSAVYMAAVTEYLAAEILELAGNCARENQRTRITPRHIKLSILNDEELNRLYKDTIIAGGVVSHIENSLMPDENKKRKTVKKSTEAKPKAAKSKVAKKASPTKKAAPKKVAAAKPKKAAVTKPKSAPKKAASPKGGVTKPKNLIKKKAAAK